MKKLLSSVITTLSVLVDVKSFFFHTRFHTQPTRILETVEKDKTAAGSPKVDDEDTKQLCAEESPSATIEGTAINSKQSRHQRTKYAADTMH